MTPSPKNLRPPNVAKGDKRIAGRIKLQTRVAVWGRSAAHCAFPRCPSKALNHRGALVDTQARAGEVCHIVAESLDGPRGRHPLPLEKRGDFENLLLLCVDHHDIIDDDEKKYSVTMLRNMKRFHEARVRGSLGAAARQKITDKERIAEVVDEWVSRSKLDQWTDWTALVFESGVPKLATVTFDRLTELRGWLLRRVWPPGFTAVRKSLNNFRTVLGDFLVVFHKHAEPWGTIWRTDKFYKKPGVWGPPRQREEVEYDRHVSLVEDLMLELTRAGNHVCDIVRASLDADFRREEGVLIVMSGPYGDGNWREHRVHYRPREVRRGMYRGLTRFVGEKRDRDFSFERKD